MNPQRLVAAVAALAIGFGVTLVGVSIADDESAADSIVTGQEFEDVDDQDAADDDGDDEADDDGDDDGGRAEQQEEVADEADPAEIEPAAPVPVEQTEPDQNPTTSTCEDLAAAGASEEELTLEGCEPEAPSDDADGPRATCRVIYEVTARGGEQQFVVVSVVQNGGVITEPDGEFLEEGVGGVERLDEVGFFFVGPDGRPMLDLPCEQDGQVVVVDELPNQDELPSDEDSPGSITEDVEAGEGDASPSATSDQAFPCDLPVRRVLDDLAVGVVIDLDRDGADSDWESYITLLDVVLAQSSGDPSFDWGVQIASTADSESFQDLDCDLAGSFWERLIETPLSSGRGDPAASACFLVQFVELEERPDGIVGNPFIDYLDDFGPRVAGCPIFESMVL